MAASFYRPFKPSYPPLQYSASLLLHLTQRVSFFNFSFPQPITSCSPTLIILPGPCLQWFPHPVSASPCPKSPFFPHTQQYISDCKGAHDYLYTTQHNPQLHPHLTQPNTQTEWSNPTTNPKPHDPAQPLVSSAIVSATIFLL